MASRARRAAQPDAKPAPSPAAGADGAARQDRLLSEISHELGNYFHKLYYWAELLREQRPAGSDAEPFELLERTIRDLETFLKTALGLFRPITLASMTMSVTDVVASVQALVKRHVDPSRFTWEGPTSFGAAAVELDPGRFSFVCDAVVRRLAGPDPQQLVADASVRDARGTGTLVLGIRARGGRGVPSGVAAAIEWAVVERVVELHGGTIELDAAGSSVRLRLPTRS